MSPIAEVFAARILGYVCCKIFFWEVLLALRVSSMYGNRVTHLCLTASSCGNIKPLMIIMLITLESTQP
jgi:hypothetical protein